MNDEAFMARALEQARIGLGRTSPNPTVGAVLVLGGEVIAKAYHRRAGAPHAEVEAIAAAGHRAKGATLYTTLEPCDHQGRTPPCSLAILEARIARVVCASADPNPQVNGRGIARLRRAGVEVVTGVLREAADGLNRPFFKAIVSGSPWVSLKVASSLDGKIAAGSGESKWITSPIARRFGHQLRDQADVILVGANTVRRDDPKLTCRLPGGQGRDPVRIVVDSRLSLPADRRVLRIRSKAPTIVATTVSPASASARRLSDRGIEVWTLPKRGGRVDLLALLARVAGRGWNHVVAEGGAALHGALLSQGLADELLLILAPKLIGSDGLSWFGASRGAIRHAISVGALSTQALGPDVLIRSLLPKGKKRR